MTGINIKEMKRDEWLRLRKGGIGGSDAGALCGTDPYKSAFKVWLDKTSEEISDEDNEAMRQGRDLEGYVAERFMEETGKKVRKSSFMYRSEERPFMIADIDRLIIGEKSGLECKTCSPYSADKWKDGAVPESYEIQCRHYMAVMGWDHIYIIACLIPGKGFVWRKIERDKELEHSIIAIERAFWEENVLKGIIPDPDGSKAYDEILDRYFRKRETSSPVSLAGFDKDFKRREEIDELMKKPETEKNGIDQKIKLYMEGSESAAADGYKVSWTYTDTKRLDTKKLKAEEPEVYERYSRMTEGRRFSVKKVA